MHNDPLRLVGTTVGGRYEVNQFLGAFGSRNVYRAEHRAFGQPVRLEVVAAGDQQRRAFLTAGGKVAWLSSRFAAITQVRDGGHHTGPAGPLAFVVTEWVDGPTLGDAHNASGKTKFDVELVFRWMDPILDAMVAAHREGVVYGHFDAHSFLVLGALGRKASLKIDGLVDAAWRPQLQGGSMPLRPPMSGYAAPELASGDGTLVGPWTDVYGLAAVLSVLLCGSSTAAMRQRGLPAGVQYAFEKALNPRIDARFKTLAAFRASMMEGLPELRAGVVDNPRRTMVVADVDSRMAEGSAGGFEVSDDDDVDAHKPTMGKARVRLAFTQPAMNVPEALANLDANRPPSAPPQTTQSSGSHPISPRPNTGSHSAIARKKPPSTGFIGLLLVLLIVAVGGGVAVGYALFK